MRPVPIAAAMAKTISMPWPGTQLRDRSVLATLIGYCNLKNINESLKSGLDVIVFPRIGTISEEIGVSESSVKRALKRLEELSVIHRVEQRRGERTGNFLTRRTAIHKSVIEMIFGSEKKSGNITGKTNIESQQKKEETPKDDPRPEVRVPPAIENEQSSPIEIKQPSLRAWRAKRGRVVPGRCNGCLPL